MPPPPPAPFSSLLGRAGCWIHEGVGPLGCKDKWDAIAKVLDLLVTAGRLPAARREAIHTALIDRERSMSTGLERGVAMPHAAVEGLEDFVTGLVVFKQGVPFQLLDGSPAQIIVMILIPKERRVVYLPVLSEVARLLAREEVREGLLRIVASTPVEGARPAPELYEVIAGAEQAAALGKTS